MTIIKKFKYARAKWRRLRRLIFMSPAEVQFLRIMGGMAVTADIIRDPRTGFPLTIVLSLGKVLKAEGVRHEVRVGAYFADFAVSTPYYKKAILVDGKRWHNDIVKERERDEYYAKYGFSTLHLPASDLWHYPNQVHDRTLRFLAK